VLGFLFLVWVHNDLSGFSRGFEITGLYFTLETSIVGFGSHNISYSHVLKIKEDG
jgi:hypothetical protein